MINAAFSYLKDCIETMDVFRVLDEGMDHIESAASRFVDCERVLVIGTGGSSLGGKCLVNFEALYSGRAPRVTFLENVDSRHFVNVIGSCNKDRTGIIVISKSGRTTETLMLFASICELWKDFDYAGRAIAITELSESSTLMKIAAAKGMSVLEHNPMIGGRFSVFSIVGLLPALLGGVDISTFTDGARTLIDQVIKATSPGGCKVFSDIVDMYNVVSSGRVNVHVIMAYSDLLGDYCKWVIQLISESLGKSESFGITPVGATGTVDQHSMLQLFLGGPPDKMFTVITQRGNILTARVDCDLLGPLHWCCIHDLMLSHQQATIEVLKEKAFVRVLEFDELNAWTVGYLMALSFVEVITMAGLAGVNPFDQPAVEASKKLAMCYLGKYRGDTWEKATVVE
jgi:glucose-6-phosphate isomerase